MGDQPSQDLAKLYSKKKTPDKALKRKQGKSMATYGSLSHK
jgi:hypothetical protein